MKKIDFMDGIKRVSEMIEKGDQEKRKRLEESIKNKRKILAKNKLVKK